ncbi:MAG: SRPBCC family protein [Bacillota bacterium]
MPFVEVHKEIRGAPEAVYEFAKDMESYPRFMKNVVKIITLERGNGYTITRWDCRLQGKPVVWTEKDVFDDQSLRIDYHLIEGDLKKFEGAWTFEPTEEGTMVRLTVDFELGIPMFAALLNPVAAMVVKRNCEDMLSAMKEQIEASALP